MQMKTRKYILGLTLSILSVASCALHEDMVHKGTMEIIFGSAQGLETYALSLYKQVPGLQTLGGPEGTETDYAVCKSINSFYTAAYTAETETSWSWGELRTTNYFIDQLHSDFCVNSVSEADRLHYEGLARWFRAYFYYNKLTSYGPVPWFDHCLSNDEIDVMYKNRDSRDVIISHIIDDLDFAAEHIQTTSSKGNTRVSKNAAYALKSRACLFEASWRKYHNEETELWTAEALYRECIDASQKLIDDPNVKLNTKICQDSYLDNNPSLGAYRSVFYSKELMTDEVILGVQASLADNILGDTNYWYTSPTYGSGICLSRAFIFTYLCKDGTPFTDKPKYKATNFIDEFTDRDERLAQTVISPKYEMNGGNWKNRRPDIVGGAAISGYQIIKFSEDCTSKNGQANNENSLPVFRYAEVLLNYAEAKAELGEITDYDWSITIGDIRRRAGIDDNPGVTSSLPTTVDKYLQETFYPTVSDPVILEIRRERAIELCLEGYRSDDLRRWKSGENFERVPWTGIHVPVLNQQFAINDDGTLDFYVTYDELVDVPSYAQNKWVHVLPEESTEQGLRLDENPDGGWDLRYVLVNKRKWHEDGRQYLYPIPAAIIREYASRGYKIDQNPGW